MPVRHRCATVVTDLDDASVARLRSQLVRSFRRRTHDVELAEDLAQESLVHVVRGLAGRRNDAAMEAWVRRIALNVWRDHLRRMVARPGERIDTTQAQPLAAPELAAEASAAEEAHDRQATHECLLEATRQLPLDGRRVLLLCDFGDMSLADAARALGCSPAAAKVRLHRARKQLAEICRAQCRCEADGGAATCTPNRPALTHEATRKRKTRSRRTNKSH